jgi:iron complex transport system substrate-binding protein
LGCELPNVVADTSRGRAAAALPALGACRRTSSRGRCSTAACAPAFPELRAAGLAKERIVPPDEVVRRAPDVIVASWCGKPVRTLKIAARAGWSEVPAVRNGHLYEIKSAHILQPGPAALTEGVRQLQQIILRAATRV